MQRWRHTGWDIPKNKVTTFSTMFYQCTSLYDTDGDFTGWCTSYTTNISTMFYSCQLMPGPINLSGWDVSNVTTMASMFNSCVSLTKIVGFETWTDAKKCSNLSSMFSYTTLLVQDLDLRRLEIGTGSVTSINLSSMIYLSGLVSLNISGWNLGNSVNGISFYSC